MNLSISGTYSSGKTLTVLALSNYTGKPHTLAPQMREILPEAVPGKTLAQVTPAEYLQLAMRRHVGRAVHESMLPDGFISDGSSLQEWIYGAARVLHGTMNPSAMAAGSATTGAQELGFFSDVVAQYGHAFRQHVKATYDVFVHLRNELPLADDGHRPLHDGFRATCDEMLLGTLDDLQIPHYVVGGDLAARMTAICELCELPAVIEIDEAITRAQAQYARRDMTFEIDRDGDTVVAAAS